MRTKVLVIALLAAGYPLPAGALYQAAAEDHRFSLGGSLNVLVGYSDYPGNTFLYQESDEEVWSGNLRLLADGAAGDRLLAKVNILQNVRNAAPLPWSGNLSAAMDVERSGALYLEQHDSPNSLAALVLDSGYLSYGGPDNLFSAGRQPVGLSVTFYFTPNDFFAPFAAQSFYRVYKPGVDALRYERSLGSLSQLSLIGVAGYEPDPEADSGWSRAPDWERTSLIARCTTVAGNFEWGLLGGRIRESAVIGSSLQGELFQWLGVRTEGHWQNSGPDRPEGLQWSLGLEHRFAGSLTLRLEHYYNEPGYGSIEEADTALAAERLYPGYLGRLYTAMDIGYEFSPLLRGEVLYLRNWTDHSGLFSLYAVYSLSNESELAFTISIPDGRSPGARSLNSELGSLPAGGRLEYRWYF